MDSEDIEKLKETALKAIEVISKYKSTVGTIKEAQMLVQEFNHLCDEYDRISNNYEFCMEGLRSLYDYALTKEVIDETICSLITSIFNRLDIPED